MDLVVRRVVLHVTATLDELLPLNGLVLMNSHRTAFWSLVREAFLNLLVFVLSDWEEGSCLATCYHASLASMVR